MHEHLPAGAFGRPELVSRRRLMQLAGGAGLAAAVAACSSRSAVESLPKPAAPPPQQPAPVPPPETTLAASASGVMLCRESWGARPPLPGGTPQTITRMTIHHTAVVLGDNSNSPERLRQHQRYHQDDKGWIDIAYHVGVDRDGNIFELRTPALAGDTATDYNTIGHFLVVCEGDFDQETVTEAQLNGAALAFAWAAQNFHVPPETLAGHRDLAATSCPGANLYAHVASGDLKERIDDMVAAGTVDLQRVCGPEAASIVAAIEAGQ